jgi:hypothetical protein
LRETPKSLFVICAVLVIAIIAGAFMLSGGAVVENLRFIGATNQILDLVSNVRVVASGQKGFAQAPGEDIWSDLEHAGQVLPTATPLNPWKGELHAVTVANSAMRIETLLPAHDCRRLALYFLGRQPAELGLLSLQAQPETESGWSQIYPAAAGYKAETLAESACGNNKTVRLALIFRIR